MAYIVIDKEEALEKALKRFRKKVQKDSILTDYKKNLYFTKPSEEEHRKKIAWKRREAKRKRKRDKAREY